MGSFLIGTASFVGRASADALEGETTGGVFAGGLPDCLGIVVVVVVRGSADPGLGREFGEELAVEDGRHADEGEGPVGEVLDGVLPEPEIGRLGTVLTETRLGMIDADVGIMGHEG